LSSIAAKYLVSKSLICAFSIIIFTCSSVVMICLCIYFCGWIVYNDRQQINIRRFYASKLQNNFSKPFVLN
jgi:hypothetical protein